MAPPPPPPHVVLFPFMSKGHTIPILHLARLLLDRNATVTIFTTPANKSFIASSLSDTNISIIDLPFPENITGVPPGIESTDKLPSMSLFFNFAFATKTMKPHFEKALETLPKVSFMITDGFLSWTLDSANKYGCPRLVYYGMNVYAMVVSRNVHENQLFMNVESKKELVTVPDLTWIKVSRNDFTQFEDESTKSQELEFCMELVKSTSRSYGILCNTFYELESIFVESFIKNYKPKPWCVGPVCLAEPPRVMIKNHKKPSWIEWLDRKLDQGIPVLYVAFGSQAEISMEQLQEIKTGLERSDVNFLWVVRKNEEEITVSEKGFMVNEWVDQREILGHESITGFLSHCGWNSVLESICAKVPILAWPMMAEQPLNAKMVVEELKVGLRVETSDGSIKGFVKSEELEKMVRELMEGELGKEVRKNVIEVGGAAVKAADKGGSSWHTLNDLIDELHAIKKT